MKSSIALLVTGDAIFNPNDAEADFISLFERGLFDSKHKVKVVDLRTRDLESRPLKLSGVSGVVMTGSASMVDENKEWMQRGAQDILEIIKNEIPFLGVCFGHQLLGKALGAKVGKNPNHRRMGSVYVTAPSPISPLGLASESFWAQVSHRDVILDCGESLRSLAHADHDPNAIVQHNERTFGVQFHPEFDKKTVLHYLEQRRELVESELSESVYASWVDALQESPRASSLLKSFAEFCEATP